MPYAVVNDIRMYYEELGDPAAPALKAVGPNYYNNDLVFIANQFADLGQMVDMQQAIPNAELLLINHAPHEAQYTHPWIVGPQALEFLERNSSALTDVSRT